MFNLDKYVYSSQIMEDNRNRSFTLIEQAIIIIMSNKCSLEKKIHDLQVLKDDCADIVVYKELDLIIELWKNILSDRYNNTGVIFMANLQEYGAENERLSAYRFFSYYDTALEFLRKEKNSLKDANTYGEIWRMELDADNPDCDIYYLGNDMLISNIVCCSKRIEQKEMQIFRYMEYTPNQDLDYNIKVEVGKMMNRQKW